MKNFDKELFLSDLGSVDWQSLLYCSTDINVIVEEWTNMLAMIIQKHAPILERRVSEQYSHWLTSDLKRMFRSRDKLKVNMTRKFLFMKNVNSSVLISNFNIKLSKTKPLFGYSHLKIKFLHKKVSGDLGRIFGLVT